jgi:hypothetical protein
VIAVIGGLALFWSNRPGRSGAVASAGYVGDRSCAGCHPAEARLHTESGHARTLRPAASIELARALDGRSVSDPELPDVSWKFALRDGVLSTERKEAGRSEVERYVMEYAFGSGHHAVTFVSVLDRSSEHPSILEHRLTKFAHQEELGLTPGLSLAGHGLNNTPHGRVLGPFNSVACFDCHTTRTSDLGPKVLDTSTMVPNIGCERCHGPGRMHVEAIRRGESAPSRSLRFGSGRWTTAEQMEVCGSCHRLPGMVKPADIHVDNPVIVRHQTLGLSQSACYTRSKGALNCVSCHDPHARTSTDQAFYEAVCLSCHGQPSQSLCSVSPRSGCIECHMPKRHITRGMMMSDHWIRSPAAAVGSRPTRPSPPSGSSEKP